MRKRWLQIARFIQSDDGPTAVEYAVLLALLLMVCFAAIRTFGTNTYSSFSNSANSIGS